MKKIPPYFTLIVLLFLSTFEGKINAQARETHPGLDSIGSQILPQVVVTANRYGSFQIKTPEAIGLLDHQTIEKAQLRSSPEALMLTPGVFVQKTNHGGGSPFLRGLTGNQTLLLIDGIRLSNAVMRYGPNQYFNTIDVFSVEKMEVLRGGGSVQYGSDAIGGTLQAFSPSLKYSGEPTWRSRMLTRVATHGMEKSMNGVVNYSHKKVAFRAGITWRNFGDLVGGDTTGRQSPTGYRELDFDLKGKIAVSTSADITMAYQRVYQSDVPVFHKVVLEDYAVNKMDPQKRELAYIRLNKRLKTGPWESAVFTASMQNNEEGRELRKNGSSTLRTEHDKVRSLGFSAETVADNGKGWSANTGLDIYHDLVNSSRSSHDLLTNGNIISRGLYPDGATMTSIGVFSMHTFDWQKWNVSAGARFSTFINKVNDEVLGTTKLTPSALVGNLGILRKLTQTSNLFVSMNTGFRAPNIDDLGTLGIVDFRYETPNFDLKPEHSFQAQVGYKFQNHKLRGEIYLYRNELYNLIVRNKIEGDSIEGYPLYQKENVERAYIQGAETAWDLKLNKAWMVRGSLTYTYGQNITRNEPARRIPPLFGGLALAYEGKNWWVNLEWQTAGKQDRLSGGDIDDNRIPDGGTPGWNVINVNSRYGFRFFKVDLSLCNLFNQDYRYHGSGVNAIGRSAFLSVMVDI